MSALDPAAMDREIARTLAAAVGGALVPSPAESALSVARDAVQVLGFAGLDRVLAACQVHLGRPLPAEFGPVVDRVRRLTAECLESGDLAALRRADAELAALAAEIESYEWSEVDDGSDEHQAAVPTLSVSRVLDDVTLAGDDSRAVARLTRLAPAVAASLRAALDWLAPENLSVRYLRLHGEPSLLEARLERINPAGITAAHRVLSAVGGSLGPVLEGDARFGSGEWMIRVPSFAARATYLLVVQAGTRLALPWHSVLKLRMVKASDLEPGARRLIYPVLDAPAVATPGADEYPVILLAHGLKRGYLIADRLVWRMMADPCDNEWGSPAAGLLETVRTDEDEIYWIAEPGRLLQKLDLPDLPALRRAAPLSEAATLTNVDVQPLREEPASGSAPAADPPPAFAPERFTESGRSPEPAAPPPNEEAQGLPPAETSTAARWALVAEDSLTARVFLVRLLHQQGVEAEAVSTAAELLARLSERPWALVLADVDLPDGRGAEWLARVRQAVAEGAPGARFAALARDAGDLDAARASGVTDALLKPYDRTELQSLLARLGLDRASS